MMPFANKIIVIHRTAVHMAVHTAMCTGRLHDPYMAVYTSVHSSVHDPLCYTAHTQLCTSTWPVHGHVHGSRPCTCTRVHGPCTWATACTRPEMDTEHTRPFTRADTAHTRSAHSFTVKTSHCQTSRCRNISKS